MTIDRSVAPKKSGLIPRLLAGEPAALARAISVIESESLDAREILKAIQSNLGKALVVGFTGPPGAGKSTLVNAFIREMRNRNKTVGVVAVDPSSPISGGAVLGDRIRMSEHIQDTGVFIRSAASRGHLGGMSPTSTQIIDLMDAANRDVVILETVGAGQSEVEMAEIADIKIVISAPGLGDDVQAIKAGILEIADILVVNKSDLPLAKNTIRQLDSMLALRSPSDWKVPVLATNALDGEGVKELADAVETREAHSAKRMNRSKSLERSRRLLAQSTAKFAERCILQNEIPALEPILLELRNADIDLQSAARRAFQTLHENLPE